MEILVLRLKMTKIQFGPSIWQKLQFDPKNLEKFQNGPWSIIRDSGHKWGWIMGKIPV
jgi:hypothetical protein